MSKPKTLQYIKSLATKRGGVCLSKRAVSSKTHIWWECSKKHRWKAVYNNVQQGYWCPYCAGNIRKTIKDAKALAKRKNGECISKKYNGVFEHLKWRCNKKHTWMASYDNIRSGKWCPNCAGVAKRSIQDCINTAKANKGICCSKVFFGINEKYTWKCDKKHKWRATYDSIQHGSWCPYCSGGKTQRKLKKILENILKTKAMSNYKGFAWLKNKNRLEIDIWFPKMKLAIEYDGAQHFLPVAFFGGAKQLKLIQKRDAIKNKLISKHKKEIRWFIRFSYKDTITEKIVKEKLIEKKIINKGRK